MGGVGFSFSRGVFLRFLVCGDCCCCCLLVCFDICLWLKLED